MTTSPRFANSQTRILATGLVADEQSGQTYYVSGAGPSVACRSVWASMVSNNKPTVTSTYWTGATKLGFDGGNIRTIWANLPNTSYKHFVSLQPSNELIVIVDPKATVYWQNWGDPATHREHMTDKLLDEAKQRFWIWTKNHARVPMLREWVDTLWEYANDTGGITPLSAHGDALMAYMINDEWNWEDAVSTQLKRRKVYF